MAITFTAIPRGLRAKVRMSRQGEALCVFQRRTRRTENGIYCRDQNSPTDCWLPLGLLSSISGNYGAKPGCQEPVQLRQIKVKPELSWLVPDSESAPFAWI